MKCCLCEQEILPDANGWEGGHNPAPFAGDRCCGECNDRLVVPARIAMIYQKARREQ
jgi:hypothetical protein